MRELLQNGIRILVGEPMSLHTTLGIGGSAKWYAESQSVSELNKFLQFARDKNVPLFFLGANFPK